MNNKTEIILTDYGQIGWRGVIQRNRQEWFKTQDVTVEEAFRLCQAVIKANTDVFGVQQ